MRTKSPWFSLFIIPLHYDATNKRKTDVKRCNRLSYGNTRQIRYLSSLLRREPETVKAQQYSKLLSLISVNLG